MNQHCITVSLQAVEVLKIAISHLQNIVVLEIFRMEPTNQNTFILFIGKLFFNV